jgi:hypothetical protein
MKKTRTALKSLINKEVKKKIRRRRKKVKEERRGFF